MYHAVLNLNSITLPLHAEQLRNFFRVFLSRPERLSWTLIPKDSPLGMEHIGFKSPLNIYCSLILGYIEYKNWNHCYALN